MVDFSSVECVCYMYMALLCNISKIVNNVISVIKICQYTYIGIIGPNWYNENSATSDTWHSGRGGRGEGRGVVQKKKKVG